MIIKRGYFFYVSTLPDLDKKIIRPGIPDNFLVRGKFVDNKIRRIRLYKTIEEAISGLYLGENFRKGTKMYVYRALGINKDYLLGPMDIIKVPYAMLIKEFWYTSSLRLEKIGEVKLEKKGEEIFKYGPRQTQAKLYRWGWYEEKRYSLEEKDYSIISDLHHSGIKRTYQKSIGRIRRKLGDQISKSIQKDVNQLEKVQNKLEQTVPPSNQNLDRSLEEQARKSGIGIKYDPSFMNSESYIGSTGEFINVLKNSPEHKSLVDTMSNELEGGVHSQIFIKSSNPPVVAHEIGHSISKKSDPKKYHRAVNARANISDIKNSIVSGNRSIIGNANDSTGLKMKNLRKSISLANQEEFNANKIGLGLLKELGANRKELRQAKKVYKLNKKSYRLDGKLALKETLREGVQNKRYRVYRNSDGTIAKFRVGTSYLDDLNRKRGKS